MEKDNIIDIKISPGRGGKRPGAGNRTKQIDWELVKKYAIAHCLKSELAKIAGCKLETLHRACERDHSKPLDEWMNDHREIGKSQLRIRRWKAAQAGHWKAIEFLSGVWLNEQNKSTLDINAKIQNRVLFTMPLNGREIGMLKKTENPAIEHQE